MRDLLVISIVIVGLVGALRRPWLGIVVWTWISIMNPHRYCYGFAADAPIALAAAVVTLVALLTTPDRESPFKGAPVTIFVLLNFWIALSWQMGVDPSGDYEQWKKIMKINLMILIGLAVMREKKHIFALTWAAAASLAVLGVKGGIFTIMTGGSEHVWGPPGSFIEDNNEFGLALIMAIPLIRFLQTQLSSRWGKHVLTSTMVLMAIAGLGTQSRGALLAISAMTVLLWWRGRSRIVGGIMIVAVAVSILSFMPESWDARMNTISDYGEDSSAMNRISAWWTAWGIAKTHFFGAGFDTVRPEFFMLYSPFGIDHGVYAAHSIYFQMMGSHGFVGLGLFLLLWLVTWRSAAWLRNNAAKVPQAAWCSMLGAMCQVALIGYLVGGAFLSLAYFDLPYDIMVLIVLTRVWVERKYWLTEPASKPGWNMIPGLAGPDPVPAPASAPGRRTGATPT